MKVAWFHKFGGPEVLVSEEAPKPAPKPGEALVRVRAVGINHVDLDHRAAGAGRGRAAHRHALSDARAELAHALEASRKNRSARAAVGMFAPPTIDR